MGSSGMLSGSWAVPWGSPVVSSPSSSISAFAGAAVSGEGSGPSPTSEGGLSGVLPAPGGLSVLGGVAESLPSTSATLPSAAPAGSAWPAAPAEGHCCGELVRLVCGSPGPSPAPGLALTGVGSACAESFSSGDPSAGSPAASVVPGKSSLPSVATAEPLPSCPGLSRRDEAVLSPPVPCVPFGAPRSPAGSLPVRSTVTCLALGTAGTRPGLVALGAPGASPGAPAGRSAGRVGSRVPCT